MQEINDLAERIREAASEKKNLLGAVSTNGTVTRYYGTDDGVLRVEEERESAEEKFHREGWLGERVGSKYHKGLAMLTAINAMAFAGLSGSRHRTTEQTAKGASAKAKAKRKASRAARKANKQRLKGGK